MNQFTLTELEREIHEGRPRPVNGWWLSVTQGLGKDNRWFFVDGVEVVQVSVYRIIGRYVTFMYWILFESKIYGYYLN